MKNIYLIASYSMVPKNTKMTSAKGYMANKDNVSLNEKMHISRGIKAKDLKEARIILDISTQTVYKNAFATEDMRSKTFMELFEYFYKANPRYIAQALRSLGVTFDSVEKDDSADAIDTVEEVVASDAASVS